ncbi:MAG: diguanylate cyclase [Porphyromonadaceae bacterium CG2_30_38_12]|nr:MAG: diguanylate cyclase [Porphyromonadaceae bacterium CG2_30_38_12]
MAEEITIDASYSKQQKYEVLLPQIAALIAPESDLIANLANVAAALKEVFGWWWVGFYLVKANELVLAPFQGPIACTRIKYGQGVCGTAWKEGKSLLVPDVEKFKGHIACSSKSVAEIVVPIFDKQKQVIAVLDVDSEQFDVLDDTDVHDLEIITTYLSLKF